MKEIAYPVIAGVLISVALSLTGGDNLATGRLKMQPAKADVATPTAQVDRFAAEVWACGYVAGSQATLATVTGAPMLDPDPEFCKQYRATAASYGVRFAKEAGQ